VTAISEVQRMEGDVITLQPLFEFKLERFTEDGRVVGDLAPTGLRPSFLPKFKRHGIELPDHLFGGPAHAMFGIDGEPQAGASWVRAESA
jgi:pilus assembly protein CpaF